MDVGVTGLLILEASVVVDGSGPPRTTESIVCESGVTVLWILGIVFEVSLAPDNAFVGVSVTAVVAFDAVPAWDENCNVDVGLVEGG